MIETWDRSKHRERWFFVLSRAWDKEKFLVPVRNRTSDLRIPRTDALPLSHRDMFCKLKTSVICSKKKNSSCELNQPCLWNELKTREEAQFRFYVFLDFFPQVSTHLSQICPGCDTHNRVRLYETLHHVILNQINWIEPFNPLNPKRDQHLFSPNNNTAESFIKIMRKNKMLTN